MYRFLIQRRLMRGVFLGCLLLPWLLQAQVQISLDRSTITLNEMAKLTVTVDGTGLNSYPEVPPVEGLGFAQTTASQSMSIVNGVSTVKILIGYTVRASKEGEFTIGPVTVKAGGKVHQSQTVVLKVTAAKAPTAAGMAADDLGKLAFMQLNVAKTEYYVGEMFPVELVLYFQNARSDMPQLKAEGFSLSNPPLHTQNRVRLATGIYDQHTFRHVAKALKTGDLTMGPVECS